MLCTAVELDFQPTADHVVIAVIHQTGVGNEFCLTDNLVVDALAHIVCNVVLAALAGVIDKVAEVRVAVLGYRARDIAVIDRELLCDGLSDGFRSGGHVGITVIGELGAGYCFVSRHDRIGILIEFLRHTVAAARPLVRLRLCARKPMAAASVRGIL